MGSEARCLSPEFNVRRSSKSLQLHAGLNGADQIPRKSAIWGSVLHCKLVRLMTSCARVQSGYAMDVHNDLSNHRNNWFRRRYTGIPQPPCNVRTRSQAQRERLSPGEGGVLGETGRVRMCGRKLNRRFARLHIPPYLLTSRTYR